MQQSLHRVQDIDTILPAMEYFLHNGFMLLFQSWKLFKTKFNRKYITT